MDLADSTLFVDRISQFDQLAKEKGIFILSGVSSFPVLTTAVTRKLAEDFVQLKSIQAGIAPSPYAGVGANVIKAITNYAGKPCTTVRDGRIAIFYGLTESMRYTISPPGKLPLNNLRFSAIDIPDLKVLPMLWPEVESVWVGVAPVPEIFLRMLNGLAWLTRWHVIPSLKPFASLFYAVINTLRWGEHRGGMFIRVTGKTKQGKLLEKSWHLLAKGNDGPYIPSMAIEILVRKLLNGQWLTAGARSAVYDITLEDYENVFKNKTITTGFRESPPADAPLYQKILGSSWHALPPKIKDLHDLKSDKLMSGIATIRRSKSFVANILASSMGFPNAGENIPVKVTFQVKQGKEIWTRNFSGQKFKSIQSEGQGRYYRLLQEKIGLMNFGMALVLEDNKLHLIVRKWNILGIPLPRWLAPKLNTYEYEKEDRFHFHIEIFHPVLGFIVSYESWLVESK